MIPLFRSQRKTIRYRLPSRVAGGFLWAVLTLRPRSLARDAQTALAGLRPVLEITGKENIPTRGPFLLTCNHYSRPGFATWWLALAITAAVATPRALDADPEIHWVMTAAWAFPESPWRHHLLTPLTRWAFQRIAQVYGFILMPPMPPDPRDIEARALAVLRTVRLTRQMAQEGSMGGLAPEEMDAGENVRQPPDAD